MQNILVIIILSFSIAYVGCASFYETEHGRGNRETKRGNLSEVIRKADDTYKGERKVEDSHKNNIECDNDNDGSILSAIFNAIFNNDDEPEPQVISSNTVTAPSGRAFLGLSLYTQNMLSKPQFNLAGINIMLSYQPNFHIINSLEFGFCAFPITKHNEFYGSIRHFSNLLLGYQLRCYLSSEYAPVRTFLACNLTGAYLFWKYNNPVFTDVFDEDGFFIETEEISSDGIFTFSPGIGIGTTFFKAEHIHPSIFVQFGANFYAYKTSENFNNDIFDSNLFIKAGILLDF